MSQGHDTSWRGLIVRQDECQFRFRVNFQDVARHGQKECNAKIVMVRYCYASFGETPRRQSNEIMATNDDRSRPARLSSWRMAGAPAIVRPAWVAGSLWFELDHESSRESNDFKLGPRQKQMPSCYWRQDLCYGLPLRKMQQQ